MKTFLTDDFLPRSDVARELYHDHAIVFGFCSVAYLVGFGINHMLAPRFEPVAFRTD